MNKLDQLKQLPEEDLNTLIRGSAFLMGVRPGADNPIRKVPRKPKASKKKPRKKLS